MLDADKILERMNEINSVRQSRTASLIQALVEEINRELEALKPKTAESFLEE